MKIYFIYLAYAAFSWFFLLAAHLYWVARKRNAVRLTQRHIEQLKEKTLVAPAEAVFNGADWEYGQLKRGGVIALTDKHLLFCAYTGETMSILRKELDCAFCAEEFKQIKVPPLSHFILKFKNRNRMAFFVDNQEQWMRCLNTS